MRIGPIAVAIALAIPAPVLGQRVHRHSSGDHDWMEECSRRSRRDSRGRHCEERTMGWRSGSGQSLSVDATPNGGVSVSGWDRDSVHVIMKIQAHAGSDEEARELAGRVQVSRSGEELRADGPPSRRYASWTVS